MTAKIKIMIIEDELLITEMIQENLKQKGYDIAAAVSNSDDAIRELTGIRPDLVLMDIHINGKIDGINLTKIINEQFDIPVIYLTAYADKETIDRAKTTESYGYIIKPFNDFDLISSIEIALYKHKLDRKLKESERKYRSLVENINDVIFALNIQGQITYMSPVAEKIFGYRPAEMVGKSFTGFIYQDDLPMLVERFRILLTGKVQPDEYRIVAKNGDILWVRSSSRPLISDGKIAGVQGVITDITEHKQIKNELEYKNIILSTQQEVSIDGILSVNNEGKIISFNRRFVEMWGIPSDVIESKSDERAIQSILDKLADPDKFLEKVLYLYGHIDEKSQEEISLKDGRCFERYSSPMIGPDATHYGRIWFFHEITERVKTELQVRRLNEEMDLILSSMTSLIIGVSIKDTITHWNSSSENILGIKSDDVLGKQFYECGVVWNWELLYQGISNCIINNDTVKLDNLNYKPINGKNGILDLTINPLRHSNGVCEGFIIMGNDLTEKRLLEHQLLQARKLESIGQLAAGVAHEINSPLQFVNDNLKFISKSLRDIIDLVKKFVDQMETAPQENDRGDTSASLRELMKAIDIGYLIEELPLAVEQSQDGVMRVSKIVQSMKAFAHPGAAKKNPANINKSIENTVTVSRNEWKYDSGLNFDPDPSLPPVPCFETELNQVVLNLIINATHAIQDAKSKGIIEKGQIIISTKLEKKHAVIRVKDNGMGIPENIRQYLFDPFFTTKEVGKGTGQGLSIAHSIIVKKHGGLLDFESEYGKGTTFIIWLPLEE